MVSRELATTYKVVKVALYINPGITFDLTIPEEVEAYSCPKNCNIQGSLTQKGRGVKTHRRIQIKFV